MKVQIVMNIELEELDSCEEDGVPVTADELAEIISDFYTADELAEIIREKLIEEENSGNGDTEYFLPDSVYVGLA
jgi:uncharacterized membrane protein YukC